MTSDSTPASKSTSICTAEILAEAEPLVTEELGSQYLGDAADIMRLSPVPPELTDYILRNAATFQPLSDSMLNKQYPTDKSGRQFLDSWYDRVNHDDSIVKRDWLVYSKCEDKAFCLHCKLFGKSGTQSHTAWTKNGFRTWAHGVDRIKEHEESSDHALACLKLKVKQSTLPLTPALEKKKEVEKQENRGVLGQLILVVLFLAQHCLSFRGHREAPGEMNRGNFLDLVSLVSKFSPTLSAYVFRIRTGFKSAMSYLSWLRQNQLIYAVSRYIVIQISS